MLLLAAFAGLRTGESLGLRRGDVDLLHGEVVVEHQAQEIAGSGRVVLAPKSEAGRRTVALPAVVVEALEHHLAAFSGPQTDSPVFTGPEGSPLRRATFSRAWRYAVRAAGAPEGLRPHDLRHHAATLTARMPGITTKELMARIGHASPRAALIYQHATRERDRAVASLDDVVAAVEPTARASVVDLAALPGGAVAGLGT
jgi:integrase